MGRLRNLVRKLESKNDPKIYIEQYDGSMKVFKTSDLGPAYQNLFARQRVGLNSPELPQEHPLITAAKNSPDPRWLNSMYCEEIGDEPPEDLSVGA